MRLSLIFDPFRLRLLCLGLVRLGLVRLGLRLFGFRLSLLDGPGHPLASTATGDVVGSTER